MTVQRVATPHAYTGLSSDTKPTTDVPAGSTFFETDTGHDFVFDGTNWGQRLYPTSAS